MNIRFQIWLGDILILSLISLVTFELFRAKQRNDQRWTDPLSHGEAALYGAITTAIRSDGVGIGFLASIGKGGSIHEISIQRNTDPSDPSSVYEHALTSLQKGRFSVGRHGSVGGYDYFVKFTRPEVFVFGISEDYLENVLGIAFWALTFVIVIYQFIGQGLIEDRAVEHDKMVRKNDAASVTNPGI